MHLAELGNFLPGRGHVLLESALKANKQPATKSALTGSQIKGL